MCLLDEVSNLPSVSYSVNFRTRGAVLIMELPLLGHAHHFTYCGTRMVRLQLQAETRAIFLLV
jgi:hypothetical protein